MDKTQINNYKFASVVLDAEMGVLFTKGSLKPYLRDDTNLHSAGIISGLHPALQSYSIKLFKKAEQLQKNVKGDIIKFPPENDYGYLQLVVKITNGFKESTHYYIIEFHSFNITKGENHIGEFIEAVDSVDVFRAKQLEYELELNQKNLENTNLKLEDINEALQTSNEELKASNEELNLTNTELEAANNNLKAANEELLRKEKDILAKQVEIEDLNQRFTTVLENSKVFVAYQDVNLKYIWLHNPSSEFIKKNPLGVSDFELFKDEVASNSFIELKLKVLETKKEVRKEIHFNKRYWSIHVKPWTTASELKGIIVLAIDVTEQREAYKKLELRGRIINALASSSKDYLLIIDQNGVIQIVSEPLCEDIEEITGVKVQAGDSLFTKLERSDILNERIIVPIQKALNGEQTLIDQFDGLKKTNSEYKQLYSARISAITGQENNIIGAEFRATEITNIMRSKMGVQDALKRGAHLTGEDYFEDLTLHMYELFNSKSAYVGVLSDEKDKIITKAIRIDGLLSDNFVYQLDDVPCQMVQQKDAMQHYEEVLTVFPEDPKLKRWDATSYVGVPISSPITGEMLGIMVIINDEAIVIDADSQYLLTILSLRAGAELLRQRATSQLEAKEKQFENITRNSPGVIYEFRQGVNGEEEFKYVSSSSYDVLEIAPHELLKNTELIYDVLHPDDRKNFFDKQLEDSKNPKPLQWIGRMITARSGEVKWVKLSSQPDIQENGDVIWYGIIDDITRQKKIENELKIAKDKAEEAANAKEDFLATMSHEIRTPLNAIYGISELLKLDPKVEEMEEIDLLKYSAENLLSLVNNILDFSKLKAGKLRSSHKPFRLLSLLNSICKSTHFLANKNNNNCVLEVDENLPDLVMGDELMLSQILHNLLGNANKFTENGTITLKVDLLEEYKDVIEIYVAVIDTGEGIGKEDLTKIFSKFEQSEHNIASRGTGLGLTITQALLQLLGSSVEVESEKGKGSKFYFQLKLTKYVENEADLKSKTEIIKKVERSPIKVLMIEDNDDNRSLVSKYFSKHEHILLEMAENGRDGIDKINSKNYDVVLMDMRMPVMSGSEAVKEIRKLKGSTYNELPIIALTADTYGVSKEMGLNDIMTKPYKFNDLKNMIEKHALNAKDM